MAPIPTSPSASALTLLHHSTSDNTHQNPRRYQTISIPATAYGHPASSPGAVAGIVLAVVGGTLLIIYLVYFSFIYPQRRRTAVVRDGHGEMAEVREERGWGRGGGDGGPDFVDVIEESSSEGDRRRRQRRRRGGARNFWGGSESAGTRSSFDDRDRGHTVEVMEEPDPPAPDPPRRKKTRKSKRRGGRRGGSSDDPFGID